MILKLLIHCFNNTYIRFLYNIFPIVELVLCLTDQNNIGRTLKSLAFWPKVITWQVPLYGIHTEYIHVVDSHLAELSNLLLETRVCSMLKMNWNNESGAHSCSLARGGCSDSFINTTHTHTHAWYRRSLRWSFDSTGGLVVVTLPSEGSGRAPTNQAIFVFETFMWAILTFLPVGSRYSQTV